MRPSVQNRLISFQADLEREVPWMYLDSLGKVTIGIGKLIDNPNDAVKLGGFVRKSDNAPATEQEIRNEWQMVKTSGTAGQSYKLLESRTNLRLPSDRIHQIAFDYANGIINYLKGKGHAWDSYAADAQLGLLSLGWIGLGSYPKCLGYVKSGNWFYAAGEASFPTSPKRQASQQRLLRNAGRVIARGLDPEVLWFDQPTQGRAFFFKENRYLSYDIKGNFIEPGRPALIDSRGNPANDWPGFANVGFSNGVDAAINWGDGRVFLFKGDKYLSYNIQTNSIAKPPVLIDSGNTPATDWPNFKLAGFSSGIDAAINWGDGRAFFFKGGLYLTYDIAKNQIILPPLPIDSGINPAADWQGLAATGFANGIDSVINWGDGRVFFFKGDRYIIYDIHPGKINGATRLIGSEWTGFTANGFANGITAAVDWG